MSAKKGENVSKAVVFKSMKTLIARQLRNVWSRFDPRLDTSQGTKRYFRQLVHKMDKKSDLEILVKLMENPLNFLPMPSNRPPVLSPLPPIDGSTDGPIVRPTPVPPELSYFGPQYSFEVLSDYIRFKHLISPTVIHRISNQRLRYSFVISSDFDTDLHQLLDTKSMSVQLRFSQRVGPLVKDGIVRHLCIDVNGNGVYTDTEYSSTTGPFDLSPFCQFGRNEIHFWLSDPTVESKNKCLFEISIVEITKNVFLKKLTQNSDKLLSKEYTKDLIKNRFNGQSCDDISVTNMSLKVSLRCPLSFKRMETPCRSVYCRHIECFDAMSFFVANLHSTRWVCPLCQSSADLIYLRVDKYFKSVLKNTSMNINEVVINSDTTFSVIKESEEMVDIVDNDIEIIEINE